MKRITHDILANVIGAILCFVVLCLIDWFFNGTVNFKINAIIAVIIVAVQALVGFLKSGRNGAK